VPDGTHTMIWLMLDYLPQLNWWTSMRRAGSRSLVRPALPANMQHGAGASATPITLDSRVTQMKSSALTSDSLYSILGKRFCLPQQQEMRMMWSERSTCVTAHSTCSPATAKTSKWAPGLQLARCRVIIICFEHTPFRLDLIMTFCCLMSIQKHSTRLRTSVDGL